ncbi:LysE family translocator [Enterovibrio calviensis]|uniref:LysE family translocator n=1 Tax=Enterovibrio calviensis TaxID=91359 RepID=UPI0037358565
MLELWAYAFGIMYSPGPVNLLGLHGGIHGRTKQNIPYFVGVAAAMFILFVTMNLIGGSLVTQSSLPYFSVLGCGYIFYIAYKLLRATVTLTGHDNEEYLTFKDGLILQLLNPKGLIATLPIVTIQFPAAGIHGTSSVFWIAVLSMLAFGAPTSYSLIGSLLGRRIEQPMYFRVFNIVMALLLVFVAFEIGYQHVYLLWFG